MYHFFKEVNSSSASNITEAKGVSGWFKKFSGLLKYPSVFGKLWFGETSVLDVVSNSVYVYTLISSFFFRISVILINGSFQRKIFNHQIKQLSVKKCSQLDHWVEVRIAWKGVHENDETLLQWRSFCQNPQGVLWEFEESCWDVIVKQLIWTVFGISWIFCLDCGNQAKLWASLWGGQEDRVSRKMVTEVVFFEVQCFLEVFCSWDHKQSKFKKFDYPK